MSLCDSNAAKGFAKSMPLLLLFLLSGCASFSEGVTRALMNQGSSEDTRRCYVRGPAFAGMEQFIEKSEQAGANSGSDLKVLMVHGIGKHLPDYSTRLAENLAKELGLDVVDRQPKNITLRLPDLESISDSAGIQDKFRGKPGDKNGTLRIDRYRSKNGNRKMTFYELTWSEITEADKRIIAYDDSGEYSFRRAGLNQDLKQFINSHLPDPLIYMGNAQVNIQLAVTQSLCWMFSMDYEQLPMIADKQCQLTDYSPDQLNNDSHVFISHSLGSRILTDALQGATAEIVSKTKDPNARNWVDALQDKEFTIFMLSNQLPLLQLGRKLPEVTNQYADYCTDSGTKNKQRVFAQTNIVAFSDPNDILSWAVPPDYEDNNMDSRMCPNLVNVIINIAEVKNVLGLEFAALAEAHSGYDNDQRVIKLITRGMSDDKADPLVKERCQWLEVR